MKLRVPHTYVLLFGLLLLAAAATHFIPAGIYQRMEQGGREVVAADSYRAVASNPAGLDDVFMAFPIGLMEVAPVVFYIFIVGGAFGVIAGTGAIEAAIHQIMRHAGKFEKAIVPGLTFLFAFGGGTFGMAEETLPFLPALVLLSRSLGYDSIVGGAMALAGANAGFSAAFLNPFTVGVAQGIAGLPLFSGIEFRAVVWLIMSLITVVFITRYAQRVKAAPETSPAFAIDQQRPTLARSEVAAPLSRRHVLALLLFLLSFLILIIGAMEWQWGIPELSALFFALAVVAGPAGGLSWNETAEKFIAGAASLAGGALVVGLARAILVVLTQAQVIDTIMYALAATVQELPPALSVLGIYVIQVLLNFLIASGSGQAALSIPIMAPLADLLGITRQTMVLAYQFGDGFTNVFTPTQGYFMAGLALIGIPWHIWARWLLPLLGWWLATGLIALLVAHALPLGPF